MKLILALLRTYPRRSAVVLAALIAAGIAESVSLSALLPLLTLVNGEQATGGLSRSVLEAFAALGTRPTLGSLLVLIVAGVAVKSVLVLLANREVGHTVARVATDLRMRLIEALVRSAWPYYVVHRTGVLANSIATEAYRAAGGFEYAARVLAFGVQAVVYAVVALLVSWQATLVAGLCGWGLLQVLQYLVRRAHRAGARQTTLMRGLLGDLTDILGTFKAIKAMSREVAADATLKGHAAELEQATRTEVTSKAALAALQEPLLATLAAIGLYVSLTYWGLKLTEVMVLVFLLVRLLGVVNKMQRQYQLTLTQQSAFESLEQAIDEASAAREDNPGTATVALERAIRLEKIGFDYGQAPCIVDLDATIPARQLTVLKAPSGTGKTTLLDMLCGLLRPQRGRILVDGVPFADLDLVSWRRQVGYVPQDTILLHDSILNNIVIGADWLSREDARAALERVGLGSFVAELPDGMDTILGERGGRVSGGQRQRIAIARALAHGPRILILDEPTSALDEASEALICSVLQDLASELTVIVATHQPRLMAAADHVIDLGRQPAPPLDSAVRDTQWA